MNTDKLKYIWYRFLWHIAPYYALKNPVHIDLELNNTCNFNCIFCWHSLPELPFKLDSMTYENAAFIVYQAGMAKAKSIKFNLRGEPTLWLNLGQIAADAKRAGIVDRMINTNGSDPHKILRDASEYLTSITVSIDSITPRKYQRLHGIKIKKNIIEILSVPWALGSYFAGKLRLNYHVNKINQDDYEYEISVLKSMGFDVVVKNTENRSGKHISISNHKTRKKICPHMTRRLTVLVNGDVYPCCVCYENQADIRLGNAFKQNLSTIWASDKRKKLIDNYKKGIYTDSCKNCTSGDIWID